MIAVLLAMTPRLLIGNYLTTAPSGIAFLVDGKAGFVVDTGAPYFAGPSAPDDSFHRIEYELDGCHVVFDWGREGDAAIGRITSDKPLDLPLHLKQSWPDIHTTYQGAVWGALGTSAGVADASAPSGPCLSERGVSQTVGLAQMVAKGTVQ
jgi:hypothetical protein